MGCYATKNRGRLRINSRCRGATHLGKYEEGLEWKKKSFEMRKRLYNNKDHADLASSLNNIGCSYSKLGKYEESEIYFNLCKEMKQRLLS